MVTSAGREVGWAEFEVIAVAKERATLSVRGDGLSKLHRMAMDL